jgi:hypothetical protein
LPRRHARRLNVTRRATGHRRDSVEQGGKGGGGQHHRCQQLEYFAPQHCSRGIGRRDELPDYCPTKWPQICLRSR